MSDARYEQVRHILASMKNEHRERMDSSKQLENTYQELIMEDTRNTGGIKSQNVKTSTAQNVASETLLVEICVKPNQLPRKLVNQPNLVSTENVTKTEISLNLDNIKSLTRIPQKILAARRMNGNLIYLIKWQDDETPSFVNHHIIAIDHPQFLINYFVDNLFMGSADSESDEDVD